MSGIAHDGGSPVGVVPEVHRAVLLVDRPDPQPLRAVGRVLVRDRHVDAVGAPLPPVVRAGHAVAGDLAAVADVGAEVRAVRLEHVQLAAVAPVGDEVLAEVAQRHGPPGRGSRPTSRSGTSRSAARCTEPPSATLLDSGVGRLDHGVSRRSTLIRVASGGRCDPARCAGDHTHLPRRAAERPGSRPAHVAGRCVPAAGGPRPAARSGRAARARGGGRPRRAAPGVRPAPAEPAGHARSRRGLAARRHVPGGR